MYFMLIDRKLIFHEGKSVDHGTYVICLEHTHW